MQLGLKTFYLNLRIKYKIIALISLIMFVVGAVTYGVQQYIFKAYDHEIYTQSARALNSASMGIENELKRLQRLSFTIATDSSIQTYLHTIKNGGTDYDKFLTAANLRKRIVDLGGLEKYVLSVQILDAFGREYASGNQMITFTEERARQIISETVKMEGGVRYIFPDHQDASLIVGREIRTVSNLELGHLGSIAVRIDINRLFHDYSNGINIRDDNLLILENNIQVYPLETNASVTELRLDPTESQGYRVVTMGGKKVFMTYLPSSYTDWTYVNVIPFNKIFQKMESAKQTVLIIYCIMYLVVILLALGFSRGITGPIERLSAKMKRVQLGHFEYEEPYDQDLPKDEAGQLQRDFRIMVQRIEELITENYVKQLVIKDTEFKALQAQINPHFLYNTLESINWSAKLNGQHQISLMVESLGALLRSSISLKEPLISLDHEIHIINSYITIQKIRFEERLNFHMDVPSELIHCQVPKLSLQPLVENAVNYGVEQMIDPCTIRVRAHIQDGDLIVTVEDDGPGMDQPFLEQWEQGLVKPKGSGLGMKNIDERIKLLFGETFGLTVQSDRFYGTKVSLRLPYEMRDEHV